MTFNSRAPGHNAPGVASVALVLAFGLLVVAACGGITPPPPAVAHIVVTPDTATLLLGGTTQLTATVHDAGNNILTGRVITWASDNTAVATVSSSGLVTVGALGDPVHVTATSESKKGTATITVRPASTGTITAQGGVVGTPTSGATVTFSPGAITGSLAVQVRDTQAVDPRYATLSSGAVHLILPITGGAATFQPSGSVQVSIPIGRALTPGATGYVRALFKGIPGEYWAPATSVGNGRLSLLMPSAGFPEYKTLLGMDVLDVLLDAEEFGPSVSASLRAPSSLVVGPSTSLLENCPLLPTSAPLTLYAPCSEGRLLKIANSGTVGSHNRLGIVLVHGWERDVGNATDYYRAQGLCSPPFTGSCVLSAPPTPDPNRELPGTAYFAWLLTDLLPQLPVQFGGAGLYVFDYQSYRTFAESGDQFAAKLLEKMNSDGLDGFVVVGHSMGGLVARRAAQSLERAGDTQAIRGIITLATMHLGTPLPGLLFAKLWTGVRTYGGQSMLTSLPRTERVPLLAYAGDINDDAALHGFYYNTWSALCQPPSSPDCANDGVVPLRSALPSAFVGTNLGMVTLRPVLARYDHSQMAYYKGSVLDPQGLFSNLSSDISLLLRRAGATSLDFGDLLGNGRPTNGSSGIVLAPVMVAVKDGKGIPIKAPAFQVTVALGSNPSGALLNGTTTVATSANGIATFSDLSVDHAGIGYTLVATAVGLSSPHSNAFTISPTQGATIVATPSSPTFTSVVGASLPTAITVSITSSGSGSISGLARGSITYGSGEPSGWLGTASLNSTTTPTTLTLQPSTTSLPIGTYHATVPISAFGNVSINPLNLIVTFASSDTGGAVAFTAITAGSTHTCGLAASGGAYCWGINLFGELGDGTDNGSATPRPVVGGNTFVEISASSLNFFTCGRKQSNTAYCWGFNSGGLLGDGTGAIDRLTPTPVASSLLFSEIEAGANHACGRTPTGEAYCWGYNIDGELGDGTIMARNAPTPVLGGHQFVQLALGGNHTCGLVQSGAAYCWGQNLGGALGDGTTVSHGIPTLVVGGHDFVDLSAGAADTCGRLQSGDVFCWGTGPLGGAGDGVAAQHSVPTLVTGGHQFVEISVTWLDVCGRIGNGDVYCWGSNMNGNFGDGTTTPRPAPTLVVAGYRFIQISVGPDHTCGRIATGEAYCWGSNAGGQLGDGTTTDHWTPRPIILP
jgi:alpha-tubulin suppressor-like RCC1 family protein/pimeloyl-ACP methyl ester carboxylesterase